MTGMASTVHKRIIIAVFSSQYLQKSESLTGSQWSMYLELLDIIVKFHIKFLEFVGIGIFGVQGLTWDSRREARNSSRQHRRV